MYLLYISSLTAAFPLSFELITQVNVFAINMQKVYGFIFTNLPYELKKKLMKCVWFSFYLISLWECTSKQHLKLVIFNITPRLNDIIFHRFLRLLIKIHDEIDIYVFSSESLLYNNNKKSKRRTFLSLPFLLAYTNKVWIRTLQKTSCN